MTSDAGKILIALGAGLIVGALIGRAAKTCPACPPCECEDNRPGLQQIAAGFRDICEQISPIAEEIENALADDQRIDVGEAAAIWRSARRLI